VPDTRCLIQARYGRVCRSPGYGSCGGDPSRSRCAGLRTCARQPTCGYDVLPWQQSLGSHQPLTRPSGPRTLLFAKTLRCYSVQSLRDHEILSTRYPMGYLGGERLSAKRTLSKSSAILCIFLGYPHSGPAVRRVTKTRSYKRTVAETPTMRRTRRRAGESAGESAGEGASRRSYTQINVINACKGC